MAVLGPPNPRMKADRAARHSEAWRSFAWPPGSLSVSR